MVVWHVDSTAEGTGRARIVEVRELGPARSAQRHSEVADRAVSVLHLSGRAKVAFCVERTAPTARFNERDADVLHTIIEGVSPLARLYTWGNGLAPGQARLDAAEREAVAEMVDGDIPGDEALSQRALRKLGVDDEFELLQMFSSGKTGGGVGFAESTGQPRRGAELTTGSVLVRARQAVRECLAAENLSIESVAKCLGMSARTLQRNLSGTHTSFSELADDARRRRARRLLAEPALDFTDIALQLGYGHVSSLNRAVKRWFDATPSQIRRQPHLAAAPPQLATDK